MPAGNNHRIPNYCTQQFPNNQQNQRILVHFNTGLAKRKQKTDLKQPQQAQVTGHAHKHPPTKLNVIARASRAKRRKEQENLDIFLLQYTPHTSIQN